MAWGWLEMNRLKRSTSRWCRWFRPSSPATNVEPPPADDGFEACDQGRHGDAEKVLGAARAAESEGANSPAVACAAGDLDEIYQAKLIEGRAHAILASQGPNLAPAAVRRRAVSRLSMSA
jgi:hypothetical protein